MVLGALSSSPVHRALVLVLGTNIAVLLDCLKSSRQCAFLTYLLTKHPTCACPRSQKTLNHLAWCVIILNAMRTAEQREREVLSATKLRPNDEGKSKAGSGVGAAVVEAVKALDVPVKNID